MIGKNVIIAAEVNVSGGNIIEDDVWVAPSSSLRGYLKIGEGATVGMGAIAVKIFLLMKFGWAILLEN